MRKTNNPDIFMITDSEDSIVIINPAPILKEGEE